ncbi:MAG: methyltransferase domain-containing protein [Chloroflexi bacterium]|nr:methyltransferase domain-containing protein [Chloroflexota bacterium]
MNNPHQLREGVRQIFSAVAESPADKHSFPVGVAYAENVGYPGDLLAGLPAAATEAFTGLSNVSIFADIPAGATALDLGCGSGLDTLIAARRVGPNGKVIGVDFSEAMLARAREAAAEAGATNVEFRQGDAERLPIEDGSIDVVIINGIFNLNPARSDIFRELARVVRPGGFVFCAEVILREPLPPEEAANLTNWFA